MIWINYLYKQLWDKIILKNYLLFIWYRYWIINYEAELEQKINEIVYKLNETIEHNELKYELWKKENNIFFDWPECRKILLYAYDVEINFKYLKKKTAFDKNNAKKTMNIFNKVYWFNFHDHIENFSIKNFSKKEYKKLRSIEYVNANETVDRFLDFVYQILIESWYKKEEVLLRNKFREEPIKIIFKQWINWFVSWNIITIWNKLQTTLLHELTHVINNCFYKKKSMYKRTLFNEWFANFVAYNLYYTIIEKSNKIQKKALFRPIYSILYYKINNKCSNDENKNYKIIEKTLIKENFCKKNKVKYFYNRFYKFFHYAQNKYLYPKELTYEIWYKNIINNFKKTSDRKKLCAKYFLWLF